MTLRYIGKIGCYVPVGDIDLSILYVFGVYEQDVVDQVLLLEQDSASQAVKIATCYKAEALLVFH